MLTHVDQRAGLDRGLSWPTKRLLVNKYNGCPQSNIRRFVFAPLAASNSRTGRVDTAELGSACSRCSDSRGGLVLAAVLGVVALLGLAAVVSHVTSGEAGRGGKNLVGRLTQYIPLQSLKIVVVAWQILTQVSPMASDGTLGDYLCT